MAPGTESSVRGEDESRPRPFSATAANRTAPRPLVVATWCENYETDRVREAVHQIIASLGGMDTFVRPGERIALKPNLVMSAAPDSGIITHPAFIRAVVEEIRASGASPFILESPGTGSPYSEGTLRRVYRRTGLLDLAEEMSLELNLDTSSKSVSHPEGRLLRRLDVVSPLLAADGLISLPKLKTHTYMVITGAVKNLFGLVPGHVKTGYHAKLADPLRFAHMLLDVHQLAKPRLSLMDGILGIEGNGPGTGGTPRWMRMVIGSADAVALDVACCLLAGLDPDQVPVLRAARERGLWSGDPKDIEIIPPVNELRIDDFVPPRSVGRDPAGFGAFRWFAPLFGPLVRDALILRPRPQAGRCTGCGVCERACPQGAITVRERLAVVDDSSCIRCYCCHELCPSAAIELERAGLGRLFGSVKRS